ncbi:SRPBCC family protein [Amycolatopsis sp. GM8]|uniref:SRPBCC family protein n=1 Tax=Amycolatopsis sp. GM8 TaxID=2896530 RepID=UPI001F2EC7BA|nr:SRPBCC family protein [Amycolatopsis sp. GM8]
MAAKQLSKVKDKAAGSNELTDALRGLAQTVATRAATSMAKKVTATSGRLTDYAEGGGGGLMEAITGAKPGVKGKAALGAVKGGLSGLMAQVKDALPGGGGGGGDKLKVTNIIEEIDVGAPVDLVYDQWTRFTEFPRFMKKVENVDQVSDETLQWRAQVLWSHRSWKATILEQVPGERIIWRSEGQKGHVDGAVTFHEIAPDLTRIVLVLAYHPQGLFEHTGNLWRAQGRRVRLELKHFRRYVMTETLLRPDEIEGWRGEIRDGEVVEAEDGEAEEEPEEQEEDEEEEEQAPGRARGGRRR